VIRYAYPKERAGRSGDWLDYWADDIGLPGFYPFDLLAAAYVLAPERFDCADAEARIRRDLRLWGRLWGPWAVLVQPTVQTARGSGVRTPVVYCECIAPGLVGFLTSRLSGKRASGGRAGAVETGAP
jgi:purine nucleosidase